MSTLEVIPFSEPLAERLAGPPTGTVLFWLGQAGFAIASAGRLVLIDPYLSDSLARKYRSRAFPHERMMPPPLATGDLGPVDLVLVTHHHTDHMDPETLAPIAAANARCRFVVPRASAGEAMQRIGVGSDRLIALDAGDTVEPLPGFTVTAIRAAHETLERSPEGHHRFLGYVFATGGARLYHSGDTVPFEDLADEVSALAPTVALLPVNGRRAELTAAGIAGNLTLAEACQLAGGIGAKHLIAHHYGMFAFNTLEPAIIDRAAMEAGCAVDIHRARTAVEYRLSN